MAVVPSSVGAGGRRTTATARCEVCTVRIARRSTFFDPTGSPPASARIKRHVSLSCARILQETRRCGSNLTSSFVLSTGRTTDGTGPAETNLPEGRERPTPVVHQSPNTTIWATESPSIPEVRGGVVICGSSGKKGVSRRHSQRVGTTAWGGRLAHHFRTTRPCVPAPA